MLLYGCRDNIISKKVDYNYVEEVLYTGDRPTQSDGGNACIKRKNRKVQIYF